MPKHDRSELSGIFQNNPIADTFRISFLANRLVLPVYDAIKRDHGLSRGEYLLIHCLAYVPDMTAQEVADTTGRPRNSISRAVHRMLAEGYLTRVADPEDGRQARLSITDQGRALQGQIVMLFEARQEGMLGALTDAERKSLDLLLSRALQQA